MIKIDDITGTYSSHCPILTKTLQSLTVMPEGNILLQGENETSNDIQPKWTFSADDASALISAKLKTAQGGSATIASKLSFQDTNGILTFSGSMNEGKADYPFVGSDKSDGITAANLDALKKLFPDDDKVQAVTLAELLSFSAGKPVDGSGAKANPEFEGVEVDRLHITDCEWAAGIVVLDCMFVLSGMWALKGVVSETGILRIAEITAPHVETITKIAVKLSDPAATVLEKAGAVWEIGQLIYTGGMFEAIYKAMIETLNWWDMILYGVLGLAEIVGAFVTDGAAIIAVIVAEIALIGFLISDSVKMGVACSTVKYRKMEYGYDGCKVTWGPLKSDVSEADMIEMASVDKADGFTYLEAKRIGHVLIGPYPKGCESPANMSWPLYLAE